MLKAQRFTLTMPACVVVSAIGLVDPSLNGSNSPSARRVTFFHDRGRQNSLALVELGDVIAGLAQLGRQC